MSFPRLGAFEVYFRNFRIFSKLFNKTWPSANKIIREISKILKNEVVCFQQSAVLTRKSSVVSIETIPANFRVKSRNFSRKKMKKSRSQPSSWNNYKVPGSLLNSLEFLKKPDTKTVKNPKKINIKSLKINKKPQTSIDKKNFLSKTPKIRNSNENSETEILQNLLNWLKTPTKSFKTSKKDVKPSLFKSYHLVIPINQSKNKKIPIENDSSHEKSVQISVSSPNILQLHSKTVKIPAFSSSSIKLTCLPQPEPIQKQVFLHIQSKDSKKAIYELDIEYT